MKTGRLLDVLSGHEGPVHGLMFSPTNVSLPVFCLFCFCTSSMCLSLLLLQIMLI